MSLLMDALRKAEEAKKKAAQESKSEEASPVATADYQQADAATEKVSEGSSVSGVELSIADIEEAPKRSAVPNVGISIEFEDEEDYVLPTSVRADVESVAVSDSNPEQSPTSENETSPKLEKISPHSKEAEPEVAVVARKTNSGGSRVTPEQPQRPISVSDALDLKDFDSLESEETNATAAGKGVASDTEADAPSDTGKTGKLQSSRAVSQVVKQARDRANNRDEPGRTTARNVFAAKKSSLLKNLNIKIAAGGAFAFVVIAFSAYFYLSLNQESAFNIPAGSYSATEYVDNGDSLDANEEQLSISSVTVTEAEDTTAINDGDSVVAIPVGANAVIAEASVAPASNTLTQQPPLTEISAVQEPRGNAANLQPELIAPRTVSPATVATTIGDTPTVTVEPEVIVQPVASIGGPSAAVTEPTNLISFRRQESVVAVDPNVGLAYTAYQQGSLDQAEGLYRQTLANNPSQRDALLGLANIAARNGNTTEALDLYSRLLARNPSDPIARAGLMELLPAGSPSEQEGELKRLINEYPDVAVLSYAYGTFLASNQRWNEAQQTYFRALQLAKSDAAISGLVNPDYAFNLAVSLEHLNQREPAQNYYREALGFSENHPAGFDLSAVRSRLASMAGSSFDE